MADPDLELSGGGRGVLLALLAFLSSVICSFLPKIRGGGHVPPGPSPGSATGQEESVGPCSTRAL